MEKETTDCADFQDKNQRPASFRAQSSNPVELSQLRRGILDPAKFYPQRAERVERATPGMMIAKRLSFLFKHLLPRPTLHPEGFVRIQARESRYIFCQQIVRIKFQEPRKQNLGLGKIACPEFLQSLFVRLQHIQEF